MSEDKEKYEYHFFPITLLHNPDFNMVIKNIQAYCFYQYMRVSGYAGEIPWWADHFKDPSKVYDIGEKLYQTHTIVNDKTVPKTSIKPSMIIEFSKPKAERSIVLFKAFSAVKSILQKQAYVKITNERWLNAMGVDDIYRNRRRFDSIKKELQANWGLTIYSWKGIRGGYYVSTKLTREQLIVAVEKKRQEYRITWQEQNRIIRQQVLHQLALKVDEKGRLKGG